ncbi:MAG: DNA polymerase IV [Chloroflexi bacterium]|nr:DNA polymerase IV [Chloroflexota bacterium]
MQDLGSAAWNGHRVVMHADMDAFYAAVEQRERPELRGKPVIVGGSRDGRGVVTAASYEARAFGVRSAMPSRQAARRCPQAEFVSGRMDLYAEVSSRVMDLFRAYTPLVEPLSLDEAFLDVTGCERRYGTPSEIAHHLRTTVREREDLPISVGVAATKSVAKIASQVAKPDGCRVISPGAESAFLDPLPVRMVWGIGPKTAAKLKRHGVTAIGDLARTDPERVHAGFGGTAAQAAVRSRGIDPRDVTPARGRRSVGNEVTFDRDVDDRTVVVDYLQQLAEHVGQRLRAKHLRARTISVKLRYADFRTITRQTTVGAAVDIGAAIFALARELFLRVARADDVYRLVGVHATALESFDYCQLPLRPAETRERRRLDEAQDQIRQRFGDAVLAPASLLASQARMSSSRYAWRDEVLG